MKKICLLFVFPIFCTVLMSCTPATVSNFELVEYGIVAAKNKKWRKTEDPNFGRTHSVKFEKIKEETDKIPAELGARFGIRFQINGEPKNRMITVEYAGLHPQLSNPRTGKTFTNHKYRKKVKIGETRFVGYKFDHDWELAAGKWVFQVLYQGKVMVEKEFTVFKKSSK